MKDHENWERVRLNSPTRAKYWVDANNNGGGDLEQRTTWIKRNGEVMGWSTSDNQNFSLMSALLESKAVDPSRRWITFDGLWTHKLPI